MIVHDIHDVLHLSLMKFCSQFPQRIIPTVPRIYAIMVGDGISVVAVAHHVVFQHRVEPKRRSAQTFNIIEPHLNALQVPAMTGIGF